MDNPRCLLLYKTHNHKETGSEINHELRGRQNYAIHEYQLWNINIKGWICDIFNINHDAMSASVNR